MNANRRMRCAVVPAALAALVLAGCQDEAPEAAPPQAPSQSQSQGQQGGGSTPAPSQTQPGGESTPAAPSAAPSSAAPGGGGDTGPSSGKKCEDDGGIVKASLAAKPNGSTQTFKDDSGTVDMTLGAPTIDKSSGDSFFPGEGMVTVIYPITIKMTDGSFFVTSGLDFGMVDDQDNSCEDDTLNAVVPDGQQVQVESLKQGDTYSAKLVFAVPAGADLSKYSVLYAESGSGKADVAWTAK